VTGLPNESPSLPSALELAGAERDEPDPELLALPDPPKRDRTLTVVVLVLAAFAALAMVFALRRDVAYALGGSSAAALGDLHVATAETLGPSDNHFVRADAMLGAAGGIRYERPFANDTFRALPVAGRPDVWVDVRVPAGEETGRWEPPHSFAGRLVRFDTAGPRHRGLARAIEQTTGARIPAEAWLLIDGEEPDGSRWALVLAALFLGFAAWNVVAITRIVRKVKA
jgi:hypothetical protein